MGAIRGLHTSPGVYTRFRDKSFGNKSGNRGYLYKSTDGNSGSGGGGGKPTPPVVKEWVFGNAFPISFS